jgi:hypothetical protein
VGFGEAVLQCLEAGQVLPELLAFTEVVDRMPKAAVRLPVTSTASATRHQQRRRSPGAGPSERPPLRSIRRTGIRPGRHR